MMDAFYRDFHPLVEKTSNTKTEHKVGERILGMDPVSGKPVSVKIGRYGPIIQIGTVDDEEKPRFAQLPKGMSLEGITLEEALDCFKLPRTLGDFEEKSVSVGVGRFGPYVRHNNAFVSIPKGTDPMSVTLEDAIALIVGKREAAENKIIKTFDEEPALQILNGRYGPYIAYEKKNYKIPENVEPKDLNLEACFKVIELQKAKGETRKPRYSKKK
jgi:DNA topoisomerase-1